jgi:hypothetical protein
MLNPYDRFLHDRSPLAVIGQTGARLRDVLARLGPLAERRPAPGKWCAREIACHLADTEIVFAFRLRQALAQEKHVIQPFDQNAWAATYGGQSAEGAVAVFTAVREWNLALLRTIPRTALATPVTHPERGEMTLETIIETMAGHDLNHLEQIEALAVN